MILQGTAATYAILRIWLCAKTTKSSYRSRICEMRRVDYSTWRVFFSCFCIGAWSCLAQDMNLRHATLLFCAKSVNVQGNGAEKEIGYERIFR